MKTAAHQYEDKLLEFAYGELARPEADAVEAHVRGCARCAQALDEIRGVRATMARLPMVSAPDAGLDSLLAYAEQAAKRNAAGTSRVSSWRRFLAPLVTVMALATVGVIGLRAKDEFDTSPASAAADAKLDKLEAQKAERAKDTTAAPAPALAEAARPTDLPVAAGPQPHPAPPPMKTVFEQADPSKAPAYGQENDVDELKNADDGMLAGLNKKGAVNSATPQSVTRRNAPLEKAEEKSGKKDAVAQQGDGKPLEDSLRQDWSNSRGGYVGGKDDLARETKPVKTPEPMPAPVAKAPAKPKLAPRVADEPAEGWSPPADKTPPQAERARDNTLQFGLGTASTGSVRPSNGPAPQQPKTEEVATKEAERREEPAPAVDRNELGGAPAQQYRAPTTPAPAPSAPPPAVASTSDAKKKSKASLSLPYGTSSSSPGRSSPGVVADEETLSLDSAASARGSGEDQQLVKQQRAQFSQDLVEQARVAAGRGDRQAEVELALKGLKLGARGEQRVELLERLCNAYDALGQSEAADKFCQQVLSEYQGSSAAQRIAQRRGGTRLAPKKAAPATVDRERKAYDLESDDRRQPAEPASVPAQAY